MLPRILLLPTMILNLFLVSCSGLVTTSDYTRKTYSYEHKSLRNIEDMRWDASKQTQHYHVHGMNREWDQHHHVNRVYQEREFNRSDIHSKHYDQNHHLNWVNRERKTDRPDNHLKHDDHKTGEHKAHKPPSKSNENNKQTYKRHSTSNMGRRP